MTYPRKQSPEQWAAQLDFAGLERRHGLPKGVLVNLVRQESGGNCEAFSSAGAHGLCQFMPPTARQYGVNTSDPVSSINGAARYLENLMDLFDGDPEKALAAYNWGQGNLRKLVRSNPHDWKERLPKETQHYIRVVSSGIGSSYIQRQSLGQTTESDRTSEATRRRTQLGRAGLPTDLPDDEILGERFFEMIKKFLEMFCDFMEAGNLNLSRASSTSGPSIAPLTPVASRVAAIGNAAASRA